MLAVSAYAKVNLTLEVLYKREDGFHEIRSVLQTISLADEISFEPAPTLEFVCDDPKANQIDLIERSVLKAVNLLLRGMDHCAGAKICLRKLNVPRAAGLGSSSSVPAAVLRGLNALWDLNLPADKLRQMAALIGSDTAFFIEGGTALAQGRGEQIIPLPSSPLTWMVLLKPTIDPIENKTAHMYGLLNSSHFSDGACSERLVSHLKQGEGLQSKLLCNTFENVAFDAFAPLSTYRQGFLDAGARSVHLAGAGPALFTLVPDRKTGENLEKRLKEQNLEAYLVHTL